MASHDECSNNEFVWDQFGDMANHDECSNNEFVWDQFGEVSRAITSTAERNNLVSWNKSPMENKSMNSILRVKLEQN